MNIETVFKWLIKGAAVCLTAPATLAVASTLYSDFGIWSNVTAVSALVLVEGALLLGWHLLDTQGKAATSGQRGLYAALVVVAYVVLWAVALAHGEGLVGIAFRGTLGVLIVYSLAEAGILAGLRQDSAVRRDVSNDRKVRKHQRKLAVNDAIEQLDTEYAIKAKQRVNYATEQGKALELEHSAVMSSLRKPKEPARDASIEAFPYPIERARQRKSSKRLARKEEGLQRIFTAQAANPGITHEDLARIVGVSRQTIGKWLADTNGNGHHDRAISPVGTN